MNKLKEIRVKNNLTQQELANKLGVTQRYIAFIEKYGATHIDPPLTIEQHLKNVRDILNAFRCSEAPEGKEFWRDVNEVFINWKG